MGIVEIYKDEPNTVWVNDETFLCVFNNENVLIADYDFCSGLKIMQNNKNMTIFINDSDLPSGKWILLATKINIEENLKEKIKVEGFKEGEVTAKVFSDEGPWLDNCGPDERVSREEREERISICTECPFFNSIDMICTVNNRIVLESTKYKGLLCPKGKWGDQETIDRMLKEGLESGEIVMPNAIVIDEQDQSNFEADLEDFLKGLE
jgi:hypothetical protein